MDIVILYIGALYVGTPMIATVRLRIFSVSSQNYISSCSMAPKKYAITSMLIVELVRKKILLEEESC